MLSLLKNKKIRTVLLILVLNVFLLTNKACASFEFSASNIDGIVFNCNDPNCDMIFALMMLILYIPLIIFISVVFFIWYKKGKEEKTFEPIEFQPIEGFNFFDLDAIYYENSIISNSYGAMCATIYDFQNRNYIKIEKTDSEFILHKLKAYDGKDEAEKFFFNTLFKINNIITITSDKDANDNDYINVANSMNYQILAELAEITKLSKNKYIKKIGSLPYIIATICYIFVYIGYVVASAPSVSFFGFIPFIQTCIINLGCNKNNMKKNNMIITVISIFIYWLILFSLEVSLINIIFFITGYIALVLIMILILNFPKRTKAGNEIYQKLRGLDLYLEKVEKPRLAITKQENPEYYNKILPYLYILSIKPRMNGIKS